MTYLKLLVESFESGNFCGPCDSRLEYLADYIFDFTTYDSEMAALFATKALEVCAAINDGKTFDYIKDPDKENYRWFLLMCNMPFFYPRLEWGTSIRGAWWKHEKHTLYSSGLFDGDKQIEEMVFERADWREFIAAMVEFGSAEGASATSSDPASDGRVSSSQDHPEPKT